MECDTTRTPALDEIDIPALKEKYRQERDKRIRRDGQAQYFRPIGEVADNFANDPYKKIESRDSITEDIDVIVVGAGWGGILASHHLAQQGVTNVRNIDSAGDFGGVWYWNQYPGIQCDNDSYCYLPLLEKTGFVPSKKFADGPEIQGYCRQIAKKYGFADQALFHTLINSLRWDEELKRWHVRTNRGDDIRARFVILACGVLNMPKLPGIDGIDKFKGKIFHTARWDYDYTGGACENPDLAKLSDKKVAIVGTGATAIQAVPHLARHAKHLYVVQRTPSSIDERSNPPTDPGWLSGLEPGWQQDRISNFHHGAMEAFGPGEPDLICDIWTEINRNLAAEFEAEGWPQLDATAHGARRELVDFAVMERLRRRVDELVNDPQTAEILKPYYRFLCKRPLSSDEFYPVFNRPNVDLVDVSRTQGVERITNNGFDANGTKYDVDCIIFASGFEVTSSLERRWGFDVVEGRDGQSIYDYWRDGPRTLHGVMAHGFPNQFYIGYTQGGLNSSVTEQFARQGEHIAYIVAETLRRKSVVVEPTKEAQDAYIARFKELEIDLSEFVESCPPSYFNNEGEKGAPWALFRAWGLGWQNFMQMLGEWRDADKLEGLALEADASISSDD